MLFCGNFTKIIFRWELLGTMFLWLFWPTLNASLAQGDAQHRAVINTYYSLAASSVVTLAICLSSLLDKKPFITVTEFV